MLANTVATAIANLSITGLTVKDLNDIPRDVNDRDCPIMFPDIQFVTNQANNRQNMTKGSNTFHDISRNLNYWVYFTEAGTGRDIFEYLPGMVSLVDTLTETLLEMEVTDVNINNVSFGQFGMITDGLNNKTYFGFSVAITISEFING